MIRTLKSPKSSTLNSYSWPPLVEKAVLCMCTVSSGTCQYSDWISKVENQLDLRWESRELSFRGRGVVSLVVVDTEEDKPVLFLRPLAMTRRLWRV